MLGLYRQFVGARSSGTSASTVEGVAAVRDDPDLRRLMGDPYALSPNRAQEPDLGRQPTRTGFDYDAGLGTWLARSGTRDCTGRSSGGPTRCSATPTADSCATGRRSP